MTGFSPAALCTVTQHEKGAASLQRPVILAIRRRP